MVREQTDALAGIGQINDSGVRILHAARALRKVAVGQMSVPLAAISGHGYWWISLGIGLAAALVVALSAGRPGPDRARASSSRSTACSRSRPRSPATRRNIPQLQATAPVLGLIVEEAVVQDGYMNALTDGFGGSMSSTTLLALLTVAPGGRRRARAGRPR